MAHYTIQKLINTVMMKFLNLVNLIEISLTKENLIKTYLMGKGKFLDNLRANLFQQIMLKEYGWRL